MNLKVFTKWGFYFCALAAIFYMPFLSSASAQEVSLIPSSQIDKCGDVDTLWIYCDANIVNMEAANFKIGYASAYVSPSKVIKDSSSSSNMFLAYSIYPDSVLINIAILVGNFDGPDTLAGIILTADSEVASTGITFERSVLRDPLNQSISHSTNNATIQIDCTAPVVTCPGDITQDNDNGACSAVVTFTPTASDNFTTTPSIVANPASGSTFPVGTTQVEVIATDDAGNADTCYFDVIVEDNEDPTITCPGNRTEYVDASCNFTIPDYTGLATGVSDNCTATPTVTQSPLIGTVISGHGTVQTITLTADDGNGNTAQCTFDVTLSDNTPPTITCPGDRTEYVDASCNFTIPDYTGLATGVSDNCTATPTVTQSPISGTVISGHGTVQTITLTADDGNGNTAQCTFAVTLSDNTPPTITCPGNRTEYVDASCSFTIPDYAGLATGVSDNCTATPTVTQSPVSGTVISGHGTVQTITLTADDGNGNTAQCTFDVTLSDNTPPTITCPGDQTLDGDANCQATLPDYTGLASGVSDNCDPSPTVTQNPTAGTVITGATTVTLTATDAATNSNDCAFDVTITDITPPTITCPSNLTVGCGESTDPSHTGTATATDNCDPDPVITYSDVQVGNVITRTWTATDDATNSDACDQTITIDDTTAPTMQTIAEPEGGYYSTAPVFSVFGFQDDCDLDSGYYQIDSYVGSWVSLFADVSGATWNDNGWALPGFDPLAQGTHTVYFRVTDDVENVNGDGGELSWQFYKDTEPPDPPTGFTVEPGHEKCKLSWTNPTGDPSFAGVEIRRNPWCVGAYPEYDDYCAPIGYPASHAQGDSVFKGLATIFKDSSGTVTMPRNVYYYSIFSYDLAGNYSTATSSQQGRATNYWLGDVSGNGNVYVEDLEVLSNAYWTSDGDLFYEPEFDIGPTYSGSPKGIPTTDDVIEFEDLVIFAINFNAVSPNLKVAPIFADQDVSGPLTLSLLMPPDELEVGKEFKVKVLLRNNPGTVKSIHLVLPYDPSQLEFVRVERSDGLKGAPCPVFFDGREMDHQVDVSLALLGGEISIGGSGEIASITFRLLEERDLSLSFSLIDLRDGENHKLSAEQEDAEDEAPYQVPSSYGLSQNYPNPYNPQTQIAYQLPEAGEVSLKIYNIRGELVRTLVAEYKPAGHHTVMWDGRNQAGMDVASGIYFYRMVSGDFSATRKMVMIK